MVKGPSDGLVAASEVVLRHLPRAEHNPTRVRSGAHLVLILASDATPASVLGLIGPQAPGQCQLEPAAGQAVAGAIQPHVDLLTGATNPEAAAIVHLIGGTCTNACGIPVGHGYVQLVQEFGGQVADLCQQDLSQALQVMIDSLVGWGSPGGLEHIPISASLAVALNNVQLARSRTSGFDYRSSSNTLVFIGVHPLPQWVWRAASYQSWVLP